MLGRGSHEQRGGTGEEGRDTRLEWRIQRPYGGPIRPDASRCRSWCLRAPYCTSARKAYTDARMTVGCRRYA
eukprot:2007253-Rhodomonas_salina.1